MLEPTKQQAPKRVVIVKQARKQRQSPNSVNSKTASKTTPLTWQNMQGKTMAVNTQQEQLLMMQPERGPGMPQAEILRIRINPSVVYLILTNEKL